MLPPSKRIEILFDRGPDRLKSDWEDAYSVKVSYRSGDETRAYEDEYVLDLGMYRGVEYLTPRSIIDVHDRLRDICNTLNQWSRRFAGLLITTAEDQQGSG